MGLPWLGVVPEIFSLSLKRSEDMSEKVTVELEINSELMRWFEEYCRDGLLDLDEELAAVVTQFIAEQIEEAGDIAELTPFEEDEEELEDYGDYDDEDKEE